VTGSVTIEGSISWTFLDGITLVQVKVSGDVYAGLFLGQEMHAKYSQEWEKDFIKKP
jgi:hypothetical protein